MNILTAWGDSLALFKPKNLKLFMLVTLKTTIDGLKTWFKYFWWIPALSIAVPYVAALQPFAQLIKIVIGFLTLTTMLLAIRPSVDKKNCAYFRSYALRVLSVIPVYMIASVFTQHLSALRTTGVINQNVILILVLTAWCSSLFYIYKLTYALFVFDGDGSLKHMLRSLLYAGKMVVYNYPSYVLLAPLFGVPNVLKSKLFYYAVVALVRAFEQDFATYTLFRSMLGVAEYAVDLVLLIFYFSLIINLYVKKVHDQFTLYFGKND